MKTLMGIFAAAGLWSAAACSPSPEGRSVEANAEMLADNLEMQADNLEMLADQSANAVAAAMIENAADALDESASNVRAAADEKIDNMRSCFGCNRASGR